MPLRKPKHLKPKEEIAKEVLRFRELKYAALTDIISGKGETKSIWFNYEIIKELWDELEYQKSEVGKPVSGVRIYLTTYPDDASKYSRQMNVVFVLTEKVKGRNKDFFIEKQADYGNRPNFILTKKEKGILGINHGTPCPPDCDGEQDPEWP